jgi:hypothetical protein
VTPTAHQASGGSLEDLLAEVARRRGEDDLAEAAALVRAALPSVAEHGGRAEVERAREQLNAELRGLLAAEPQDPAIRLGTADFENAV